MKTSIAIKRFNKAGFDRACLPGEHPENKMVPHYIAPHRAHGIRGSTGETAWDEPEAVHAINSIHRPDARGKLNDVRIIPDEVAHRIGELDMCIAEHEQHIRDYRSKIQAELALAFKIAKPLTIKQVKEWKAAREAAKLATA